MFSAGWTGVSVVMSHALLWLRADDGSTRSETGFAKVYLF